MVGRSLGRLEGHFRSNNRGCRTNGRGGRKTKVSHSNRHARAQLKTTRDDEEDYGDVGGGGGAVKFRDAEPSTN